VCTTYIDDHFTHNNHLQCIQFLSLSTIETVLQKIKASPTFLPRDAMLARYMLWPCVRLCLCLSQVGVLLKLLNIWITLTKPHDSPESLVFWCQRSPRNSTPVTRSGAPNAGVVGQNRLLLTNSSLYLENGTR